MRGKLDLVLMGRAMLNKSLIQFSVDGRGCVPFLLFHLSQTLVEVRSHAGIAGLSFPYPAAGHGQPTAPLDTPGHSWASLGQSRVLKSLLHYKMYLQGIREVYRN